MADVKGLFDAMAEIVVQRDKAEGVLGEVKERLQHTFDGEEHKPGECLKCKVTWWLVGVADSKKDYRSE